MGPNNDSAVTITLRISRGVSPQAEKQTKTSPPSAPARHRQPGERPGQRCTSKTRRPIQTDPHELVSQSRGPAKSPIGLRSLATITSTD